MSAGSILNDKHGDIESLKTSLELFIEKMASAVKKKSGVINNLPRSQKISAVNLIQYLALRSEDIRSVQDELHRFGLSSLASSESHILRQVQAILERLGKKFSQEDISPCDYNAGRGFIDHHSTQLFGPKEDPSIPYLMVTFDTEFVDN